MISPHLMIIFFLLIDTTPIPLSSTHVSQGRSIVDPHIPSYVPQDVRSEKLTIFSAEIMEPLVRAWANELTRQHPELMVTVTTDPSESGLRSLLTHQAKIAALPRRITRTEIAEFILEYGYEPIEVPVAGKTQAILVRKHDVGPNLASASTLTSTQTELALESAYHTATHTPQSLRHNLHLYIAQPPTTPPTQAVVELVRYALSRQGQQWALELGHSPLSLAEVRRITSKWLACCTSR